MIEEDPTSGPVRPELDAEVLFLLLQHLRQTPCSAAAQVLEQEAGRLRLLPTRTDIHGEPRPCEGTNPACRSEPFRY